MQDINGRTGAPDAIWYNGELLTMDARQPRARALAVRGGQLLAVGDDADILALAGPRTVRHDLRGRFVMPGLIDSHAHGIMGALRDTIEVYVGLGAKLDVLLAAVRDRAAKLPPGQWVVGGPWHMRDVEQAGNPRLLLDSIAPDHPVCLRDATYHTSWLNSAALKLLGLDGTSADPDGGRIGRDDRGAPDGLLYESAQKLVAEAIVPTAAQLRAAVTWMHGYLQRYGITAFKEAMANEASLAAYHDADSAGELQLHVAAHMARRPLLEGGIVPFDELDRWRGRYASRHLHTGFIKLFLDGVAPTHTASFLEPYCDDRAAATRYNPEALLLIDPQTLADELAELDRRGYTVKMHAVGDRAVRAGLDAIAATRAANGDSGLRHEIGHTAFVHEDDYRRFAALGAIAEMSPRLWFPNPVTPGQIRVLGPVRTNRCHQIRSLMAAGALLVYGSDWPAAAADANPWVGLAGMLTRRNPFGLFDGAVGEGQAITLEQALPLFTSQGAWAMRLEDSIGTLAPGRSADFIVLDRPLAGCSPEQIARTQPRCTVFEGAVVFEG